ncbi:MAG: phosphoribosylformylglycinamidine synthase [Desulfovibrio sp.]|nr:phosphoribosylformylglycinamidine synthase [Desulfovibrio sp.]
MLFRIEIGQPDEDAIGRRVKKRVNDFLRIPLTSCRVIKVFTVDGLSREQVEELSEKAIWHDPILRVASLAPLLPQYPPPQWFCEIGFRPGVTDNEGKTAAETAAIALNIPQSSISVYTATQYRFSEEPAAPLDRGAVEKICRDLLCNELIQYYRVKSAAEWERDGGFEPVASKASGGSLDKIETIDLNALDDEGLLNLSRKNTWALNLEEMKKIRAYFNNPETRRLRETAGISIEPTDAELEALAQTWSEHCKHKIFASRINYLDQDSGRSESIDSLYKTCVQEPTAILRARMGANDYCRSVFKDNAGVISFVGDYDVCIKAETHNSPSALDPYGGALTGIVGVNRDPLGTGMGAELICNMAVFCFASPFFDGELPPRLLHPARILEGVRAGIEDGGNKSGIPTINGSIVFDPRYLGKPLVFCGTVGLLPASVRGHPGYEKAASAGDIIVMVGGRIGKDGIHGATFSSEELHEGSPVTAVQIGDPITQRKMYDFILVARDAGLYRSITDNGAGGLSSSVGEMAEDTGGCVLELDKAPLKYDGLRPWEILVSEAQERMTLAVPPEKLGEFLALAERMDVLATPLGHFTESGFFDVRYKGRQAAYLSMEFLHHGNPRLKLDAVWKRPKTEKFAYQPDLSPAVQNEFLKSMLGSLNICSKESIVRQYDHEVRGGSVVKPFAGIMRDGPTDAAVIRPLLESDAGLVLAHGICPKYSDQDTYWMMANAIDEAIRNAVAVGADPDALAGVDNFCWPDPVYGPDNPEGRYKLGQLVRACRALRQFALAYGVPCVSGKDSMKNDYLGEGKRISIPPTILFTVLGAIDNVTRAQTSDFKRAGDLIYLLGGTWNEMGASEAASQLGLSGGKIPLVNADQALTRYRALHALMKQRVVSACHDCSDGGLAVALAEMCVGGRLGCRVELDKVAIFESMNPFEIMYSESASRHIISVRPDLASLLDALGMWQLARKIGVVTAEPVMRLSHQGKEIVDAPVEELAEAFKKTLEWA